MTDKIQGNSLNEKFVDVVCPYCNSEEYIPYRSVSEIVKCINCETVFLRRRFSNETHKDLFKRYIPDNELIESEDDLSLPDNSREVFFNGILELTNSRGYFFDIGSGWGSLLKLAKEYEFIVKGYELNDSKAGFSMEKLGLNIDSDFMEDATIENESVDIITSTYSLSNIDKVKLFFEITYKKLKHGGLFCGIVNNIDSFASEALEDEWESLNPYENTIYFSPQTLTNFLESEGFVIERLYTTTGNYDFEMLKHIVADAFDLTDDNDIIEQIKTINADGMGEEIWFYARKPMIEIFEKHENTLTDNLKELHYEIIRPEKDDEFDNGISISELSNEENDNAFDSTFKVESDKEIIELDDDNFEENVYGKSFIDNYEPKNEAEYNIVEVKIEKDDEDIETYVEVNKNDFSCPITSFENKLIINILNKDNYNSVIYDAIKNMDHPMKIEVSDKNNFLPDYAKNWNGLEIIKNDELVTKEMETGMNDMKNERMSKTEQDISNINGNSITTTMNRPFLKQDIKGGFVNTPAKGVLPQHLPSPLSLNVGCGNDIRKHFINIDLFSENPEVVCMDIRKLELPDECTDLILASDVLEHFSHREVDEVLKEWARVLKPNGNIIIRCPSLRLQMKTYMNGAWDADIASYMIFGGQTNPGDYHCIGFDEKSIKTHLVNAGFEVVDFVEKDFPQDKGFINLNMTVRAKKRGISEIIKESEDDILKEKIDEMSVDNEYNNEFIGIDFEVDNNDKSNCNSLNDDETTDLPEEIEEQEDYDEWDDYTAKEDSIEEFKPELNIVWEGSQFAYHSLALVNRSHCYNILRSGVAELTTVPVGSEDFSPVGNEKYENIYKNDIRIKPPTNDEIATLPYAWIRHQWPPKEEEPKGAKWIIMQPWEYSYLWKEMADIFKKADEIWTPSNYSRNAMMNSGLEFDKVQIIPNGIDPKLFKPNGDVYYLNTEKKFKFLFVGGTIFRKGIDILLNAYTNVFNSTDNVSLVIKDMGTETFYKGMTAKDRIKEIQGNENSAEIIYIEQSLTEQEMASLYRACDVLVLPYRGEGFSLPTLEAMACGLPVVVTKGGATDDFCDEEVAWLIDSKEVDLGYELDGKELCGNATLLEPNIDTLTSTLRIIYDNPSEVFATGVKASYRARTIWTWNKSTLKLLSRLDYLYNKKLAISAEKILTDFEDSAILIYDAEIEFNKSNYEKALNIYENIIVANGLSEKWKKHVLLRIASIYLLTNDFEKVHSFINEAEAIVPDSVDIKYIKSKVFMKENKWIEALEGITEILDNWAIWKYDTTLGLALDALLCDTAEGLLNIEDVDNSLKLYSQALKYNTQSSRACLGSAKCFIWADAKEQAREMLEWAVKLDPNNQEAQELLSQSL